MKNREHSGIGTGISSMVMMFVVLCLTIFALLTYMTARADYRLARRSASAVQGYYAADVAAEEALSRAGGRISALGPDASLGQMASALAEEGFSAEIMGDVLIASLEIPVTGDSRIYRLELVFSGSQGYQVTARRIEDGAVWEEEIFDLWDGE